MEQDNLQKTKKSIFQIIVSIWSYLALYLIAFGIFFSILSLLLNQFLEKNIGEILSYLFLVLIYIYSVKMVVKIVTKKTIIFREDIFKISLGTTVVLIIFQVAIIIFNILHNLAKLTNLTQGIITGIILALLLFLTTYYWLKKSVSQDSTQYKTEARYLLIAVILVAIIGGGILVYFLLSKPSNEFSVCDDKKIQTQYDKDDCYRDVAKEKKDFSICDKIQFQYMKDDCYQTINGIKKDSSICDKIQNQSMKDACYKNITPANK